MYNFLYNHFKKQIADKIRLIYTDTDSLIKEVEMEDIYKGMQEHKKNIMV